MRWWATIESLRALSLLFPYLLPYFALPITPYKHYDRLLIEVDWVTPLFPPDPQWMILSTWYGTILILLIILLFWLEQHWKQSDSPANIYRSYIWSGYVYAIESNEDSILNHMRLIYSITSTGSNYSINSDRYPGANPFRGNASTQSIPESWHEPYN